jgi:hydroxyacyl-ACP dehydratase HTD2-like protein with hotdog domain
MTGPTYESVAVGQELPTVHWGPIAEPHLMRWSASIENWHRIHYDAPFATGHDGLPALLVNGSLKQHLIVAALRGWIGPTGWLWHLSFRFHGMDVVRDTLTFTGTVVERREFDDFGVAAADVKISNQRGDVTTTGTARVALPYTGGPAVPYPFPRGLPW